MERKGLSFVPSQTLGKLPLVVYSLFRPTDYFLRSGLWFVFKKQNFDPHYF